MALTAGASESVGVRMEDVAVPIANVAVPVSDVTVSLSDVTASEASVAGQSDSEARRNELIAAVRGEGPMARRLSALAEVWDQDDVFYLFFRPGDDRSVDIRVSAVNRLAEIDVLKAIGEKTGIPAVSQAIAQRLAEVYSDSRDRELPESSSCASHYVRRMKAKVR